MYVPAGATSHKHGIATPGTETNTRAVEDNTNPKILPLTPAEIPTAPDTDVFQREGRVCLFIPLCPRLTTSRTAVHWHHPALTPKPCTYPPGRGLPLGGLTL